MKVWILSFVILLALVECYQWVKQYTVPFPLLLLGGTFLAIASNADKLVNLPFVRRAVDSARNSSKLSQKDDPF
jgi:hypothetical protein